jgi:hypothetical protein
MQMCKTASSWNAQHILATGYAGYVQDERYAVGEGMRTTAGMQEVE